MDLKKYHEMGDLVGRFVNEAERNPNHGALFFVDLALRVQGSQPKGAPLSDAFHKAQEIVGAVQMIAGVEQDQSSKPGSSIAIAIETARQATRELV